MKEHDVTVNGINIHYLDWLGNGPTIVCVHGLTANCRYFDSLGEKLSPEFRVITYDLRGRGNSGKPSDGYNLAQHVSDLLGLFDALSLEKPVLIGHSLGAAIAATFASQHPERMDRLVLVDGGGGGPQADYDALLKQIGPMINRLSQSFRSVEDYLETVRSDYGDDWTQYAENVYAYDAGETSDGMIASKFTKDKALRDFMGLKDMDPYSVWDNIRCPTLLLRAPGDYFGRPAITDMAGTQTIASVIPNCKWVEIKNSNHATILLGDMDTTSEEIRVFLDDPTPRPNLGEIERQNYKLAAEKILR